MALLKKKMNIEEVALFPQARWKNASGDTSGEGEVSLKQIKEWREGLDKHEHINVYPKSPSSLKDPSHLLIIKGKTYWATETPEKPVIELNGTIFRAITLEREKEIIAAL